MAYQKKSKNPAKSSKIPPTKPANTPSGTQRIKSPPMPMNAMAEPEANKREQGTGRKRGGTVGPTNSSGGRRRTVGNRRY